MLADFHDFTAKAPMLYIEVVSSKNNTAKMAR